MAARVVYAHQYLSMYVQDEDLDMALSTGVIKASVAIGGVEILGAAVTALLSRQAVQAVRAAVAAERQVRILAWATSLQESHPLGSDPKRSNTDVPSR
jgi:hypothetical protein